MGHRYLSDEETKYLKKIYDFFEKDSASFLEANKKCQSELKEKHKIRRTEKKRKYPGGLNFPFALCVFSVIEVFGAAYAGSSNAGAKDVGVFMSKYFGPHYSAMRSAKYCEALFNVFRNGVAHDGSPKKAGVDMWHDKKDIVYTKENNFILNLPPLVLLVKAGLRQYLRDLSHSEKLTKNYLKWKKEIDAHRNKKITELLSAQKEERTEKAKNK